MRIFPIWAYEELHQKLVLFCWYYKKNNIKKNKSYKTVSFYEKSIVCVFSWSKYS